MYPAVARGGVDGYTLVLVVAWGVFARYSLVAGQKVHVCIEIGLFCF